MKKSVFIVALLLLEPLFSQAQSLGTEFKFYRPGSLETAFSGRYEQALGNFGSSMTSVNPLPSSYSFENANFVGFGRYSLSTDWAVFALGSVGYTLSKDATTTRTNSSLNEVVVGTDFRLAQDSIIWIPEISASFPMTENNISGDTAAVGDGVRSLKARMLGYRPGPHFRWGGSLGFQYRDGGLSSLIPYTLFSEFKGTSLIWGAGLRGYFPIGLDSKTNFEQSRDNWACRANGCAKRYQAVNPQLHEIEGSGRFKFAENWDMTLGLTWGFAGKNTASTWGAFAQLNTAWGFNKKTQSSKPTQRPAPSFREETEDGVDQNLFEDVPLTPEPEETIYADPAKNKPKSAPKADPKKNTIQNDLDKTEMQIELKSIKKRSR